MRAQFVIVAAMACAAAFGDAFEMERVNARAREIVAKMTLREKVNEMTLATGTLADLKRQFDTYKMARMIEVADGDIETTKARLQKLIRDVNKCITLFTENIRECKVVFGRK